MARAELIKRVEEELREHYYEIGQMTGLGDNVVFDVTLDSEVIKTWLYKWFKEKWQAAKPGTSYRMWRLKDLGDKEKVWGKLIQEVNTELAKNPKDLGNIKVWSARGKNIEKGAYWVGRQNVIKKSIKIRYIRSRGKGVSESLMAKHAGKYKDLIYNKWLEHIEDVMGDKAYKTHYGRQARYKASGSYEASVGIAKGAKSRVRTIRGQEVVKNPFTRARSSRNLKQKYPGVDRPRYGPMQVAHKTTKGAMALRTLAKSSPGFIISTGSGGVKIEAIDIVKELENNLRVQILRKKDKGRGKGAKEFGGRFIWHIKASLESNYAGSESTDLKNLIEQKGMTGGNVSVRDAIDDVLNKIAKTKPKFIKGFLNAKGSPSPKDEIVADTVFKIVDKIKRKNKKAKVNIKSHVKPFTKQNEKIEAKRPKNKKTIVAHAATIRIAGKNAPKPKEEKRAQPERGASNLLKLERVINKRLPAEVRRNMGRPALINRTGRFSNSVKLESLRETGGGISGEYSYMLSPYETFENTGVRKWPIGYNPKPLITMSIRKLAMQYTDQKFTQIRRT